MSCRVIVIATVLGAVVAGASADEVLYRYEGNVAPCDPGTGWICGNPCETPCSDSVEDGHYVLRFASGGDLVGYALFIANANQVPPSTLWVEWRFRSNHPLGPNFFTCDADLTLDYKSIHELINMYGDAVISASGGSFVGGLDIDQFHTFRFESLNGIDYRISVDGLVFLADFDTNPRTVDLLQLGGQGGCDGFPNTVNEWDFVRYGKIATGERIIATDPPAGFLLPAEFAGIDRFTVTFDSANYVVIDDITVEVTGGDAPLVLQTRRRENDEPDTMEIVLDRPMPVGQTTRFIFNDGTIMSEVEYTLRIPIPTLSGWGLAVLSLLVASAGIVLLRRRRTGASA